MKNNKDEKKKHKEIVYTADVAFPNKKSSKSKHKARLKDTQKR